MGLRCRSIGKHRLEGIQRLTGRPIPASDAES